MSTFYIIRDEDDLTHHGIKGQKWGIRRFQNADGSLTSAGQRRYKKASAERDKALDNAKRNQRTAKWELNNLKSVTDYKTFRKQAMEDNFGDDAKDEKKLNEHLKVEWGVEDFDEFYETYLGTTVKRDYDDFTKTQQSKIKKAEEYLSKSNEVYNEISNLNIVGMTKRDVKKAVQDITDKHFKK